MGKNLSWNAQKKELWKKSTNELQQKLQEIQHEILIQEKEIRGGGYKRMANYKSLSVNLKRDRHRVACIKTMLHVKLQNELNREKQRKG